MRYTVIVNDEGISWHKEGSEQLHRENGPAVEHSSGGKEWYINGKLHREDGPAVEYSSGNKHWYLEEHRYTEEEFNEEINRRKSSCSGKIVEIDGKKYKLTEV